MKKTTRATSVPQKTRYFQVISTHHVRNLVVTTCPARVCTTVTAVHAGKPGKQQNNKQPKSCTEKKNVPPVVLGALLYPVGETQLSIIIKQPGKIAQNIPPAKKLSMHAGKPGRRQNLLYNLRVLLIQVYFVDVILGWQAVYE